jgi:hypothetical protein
VSVLIISKWDAGVGLDEDMYWRLTDEMGTRDELPEGLEQHQFGGSAAGGHVLAEVWASEEAFGAFAQGRLGPASQKFGCPPPDSLTILPLVRQVAG